MAAIGTVGSRILMTTLALVIAAMSVVVWDSDVARAGDVQLLTNTGFDDSLNGWDLPIPGQVQWNSEDVRGDPESGSVEAINADSEVDSETVVLRQCVSLVGRGTYRVSTSARLLDGQNTTGSVIARLVMSHDPGCPGSGFSISGRFVTTEPADWQTQQWEISSNGATGSALIEVAVRKNQAGGELTARIDDVRLEWFDEVFSDRFESPP